jgi:hypothetical protein
VRARALSAVPEGTIVVNLSDDESSAHARSPIVIVNDGEGVELTGRRLGELLDAGERSSATRPDMHAPRAEAAATAWFQSCPLAATHPVEAPLSHRTTVARLEGSRIDFAMEGDEPVTLIDSGTMLGLLSEEDRQGISAVRIQRFASLHEREENLIDRGLPPNVIASANARRFGGCSFSAELICSIAPRLAVRMAELQAVLGPSRINEWDMQPAAEGALTAGIHRMIFSDQGLRLASRRPRVRLPLFSAPLGPVDVVAVLDREGRPPRQYALIELKWSRGEESPPGSTFANCLWDAVKLAGCVRDGPAECGYLVAGGPARAFLEEHPGTEPFTHAQWSVTAAELADRYARFLEFTDIDVRLIAVPERMETRLITPAINGVEPDTLVIAAAQVLCDRNVPLVPWPKRQSRPAPPADRVSPGGRRRNPQRAGGSSWSRMLLEAVRCFGREGWRGPPLERCDEHGSPISGEPPANRGRGYLGVYLRLLNRRDLVFWLHICQPGTHAARPEASEPEIGFCVWTPASTEAARRLLGEGVALALKSLTDVGRRTRLRTWAPAITDGDDEAGDRLAELVGRLLEGA